MSPLSWLVLVVAGPPLTYGLFLLLHESAQRRRRRQRSRPHSVVSIAARLERESLQRPVRWPRVDSDRGVVCDDRPTIQLPATQARRESAMTGHLEEAAGALQTAAGQVPVDLVNGADQQLGTVVQYIQQAGGPLGEQLTGEVFVVQSDLQSLLGRLADLQGRLQMVAQQVVQGGG